MEVCFLFYVLSPHFFILAWLTYRKYEKGQRERCLSLLDFFVSLDVLQVARADFHTRSALNRELDKGTAIGSENEKTISIVKNIRLEEKRHTKMKK